MFWQIVRGVMVVRNRLGQAEKLHRENRWDGVFQMGPYGGDNEF